MQKADRHLEAACQPLREWQNPPAQLAEVDRHRDIGVELLERRGHGELLFLAYSVRLRADYRPGAKVPTRSTERPPTSGVPHVSGITTTGQVPWRTQLAPVDPRRKPSP